MICVDSSLAVKWVLVEEYSSESLALYEEAARGSEPVVAPALFWFEATNVFRQRVRRKVLSIAESIERLRDLERFDIAITASQQNLHAQALEISHQYDLPASYDAHYIALSRSLGCDLWTADERLLRALDGRLAFVRWIADFRPGEPL